MKRSSSQLTLLKNRAKLRRSNTLKRLSSDFALVAKQQTTQVGLLQEMERLNKKIKPRRSAIPSPEPTEGGRFFRSCEKKPYMAELPRQKVSSPQVTRKKFVSSMELLISLKGLQTGMLTTSGEQFKRTEKQTKRLLISDGIMQQNGYLNKEYIRRLNQLISASMPSSPRQKTATPSTFRSSVPSSPKHKTFRDKVSAFEL